MSCSSIRVWSRSFVLLVVVALAAASLSVATANRASATQFGGTVYENPNETYREAYKRVTRTYGKLDAVRMFFPGTPGSWSSIRAKVDGTPVVASFKMSPTDVVRGKYDGLMKRWFRSAPTSRPTYWSYWHEPEEDVSTRTYRHAWQRLAHLAAKAHNPSLKATLILMCWTLDKHSGRNWKSYYAGRKAIDVVAFDCYNTGRKNGVYKSPRDIIRPVIHAAKSVHKPFGIAEFGTTVIKGDGGQQGRATWLRQYARYVQRHGGRFATYFDSYMGYDYRLHDRISQHAWRGVVSN
jgi:hypothetical protein